MRDLRDEGGCITGENGDRLRAAGRARERRDCLDDGEVRLWSAVLLETCAARQQQPARIQPREERSHQRRLTDPRLTADEAHLPPTCARGLECPSQGTELRFATHDERIDFARSRQRRHGHVVAQLRDEAVTPANHGFDHALAERLSQLVQMAPHGAVTHYRPAPNVGEQLFRRDELFRMLGQVAQDGERLSAQNDLFVALPQPLLVAI